MYFQWPFLDQETLLFYPTQPLMSLTPKKEGEKKLTLKVFQIAPPPTVRDIY